MRRARQLRRTRTPKRNEAKKDPDNLLAVSIRSQEECRGKNYIITVSGNPKVLERLLKS